jgi:hypothetical protein
VESRACCIPLPILGFAAFLCARPAPPSPVCRSAAFPATLFVPLEEFPSPAAAPCHHGRCPLAVPPGASSRSRETRCQVLPSTRVCASDADFEALLRLRVRSVVAPLPVRHALSFRWALFPFKVPSTWKSTLPSATAATGGLVRGAIVRKLRSAPVRAAPLRCCHRATGMPRPARRSEQTGTWKPPPPKRRGAGSIRSTEVRPRALDSGNVRAEAPTIGSRAGRIRRGEPRRPDPSAVHRGDRSEPVIHPEPDRSRVSGTPPRCRHRCGPVLPESIRSRSSRRLRAVDLHGVVDVKERSEERSLGR